MPHTNNCKCRLCSGNYPDLRIKRQIITNEGDEFTAIALEFNGNEWIVHCRKQMGSTVIGDYKIPHTIWELASTSQGDSR